MAVSRLLLYPERPLAKRICWTLWALQHGAPWGSMELHGAPWSSMQLRGAPWSSMELQGHEYHAHAITINNGMCTISTSSLQEGELLNFPYGNKRETAIYMFHFGSSSSILSILSILIHISVCSLHKAVHPFPYHGPPTRTTGA